MEETMIEIPDAPLEDGWQPPMLTHIIHERKKDTQRLTDVFFIQYVTCVLLVMAVFVLRFCDRTMFCTVVTDFYAQSHSSTAAFVEVLIGFFQTLWS